MSTVPLPGLLPALTLLPQCIAVKPYVTHTQSRHLSANVAANLGGPHPLWLSHSPMETVAREWSPRNFPTRPTPSPGSCMCQWMLQPSLKWHALVLALQVGATAWLSPARCVTTLTSGYSGLAHAQHQPSCELLGVAFKPGPASILS